MVAAAHLKFIIGLSVFIGVLSIGGLIALLVVWHTKLTPFKDFAIVVDAGSTHSNIFLYQWPADKSDGLGLTSRVSQKTFQEVAGGPITSITDPTPSNIQNYFDSAMSACINEIPTNRKSRALIFLGGTAGLRLFEMKNSSYTNNLLNGVRTYFSSLNLHFKSPQDQVRIISGIEEGLSGWISTNLLVGELYKNNKPSETYGVSDMGGASTQLSFYSHNATEDHYRMNLFNTDYDLYSHSYLCYGTERMRYIYLGQIVNDGNGSSLLNDPCLQKGFNESLTYKEIFDTPCARDQYAPLPNINTSSTFLFMGTGDSTQCSNAVQKRFNKSVCASTSCSFDNVYQPKPIDSSLKFMAISAWYKTFNTLAPNVSLAPNAQGNYDFTTVNLSQINKAIAAICNQLWSDLPNPDIKYRPFLCFNSMYHWTLYQYGYSMTDENLKNFQIVKAIDSNEIGWTLGYMINQTNSLDPDKRPARLLTKAQFGGLLFLSAFVLIVSIVAVIVTYRLYTRRRDY